MLDRTTVRTGVTLVAALCVVTMFAGSAAAVDLGAVDVADSEDDAVVDVNLDTDADDGGGGGSGSVDVNSDQGSGGGSAAVDASPEEGVNATVRGGGTVGENGVSGGVNCDIPAGQPEDPSTVCQPIGDDNVPIPPENFPPEDSPIPPENFPPEDSPIPPENFPPENTPTPGNLLAL